MGDAQGARRAWTRWWARMRPRVREARRRFGTLLGFWALWVGRWLDRVGRRIGGRDWRAGAGVMAAAAFAVLAVILLAQPPAGSPPRAQPRPAQPPGRPARPAIIGYFENGWSRFFDDSFPSTRMHSPLIDEVLANWYSVGGDGAIARDESRPAVTAFAKAHRIRMGILVNNVKGAGTSRDQMLTQAGPRRRTIAAIAGLVGTKGYQAVDIDFQLIPPRAGVGLTQLVCGLRAALPRGTELSAAVFPPVGVAPEINGAYDYAALADCTDYLVVMLYDYHYTEGAPGPLSPAAWVRSNVRWLLSHGIPPKKIVVAAGLYGIDWDVSGQTGAAEERPLDGILGIASDTGATLRWSARARNPFFYYTDDGGRRHVVWYQDWRTLRQRLDLVKSLGLRGVALWRLGYEVPDVWRVVRGYR